MSINIFVKNIVIFRSDLSCLFVTHKFSQNHIYLENFKNRVFKQGTLAQIYWPKSYSLNKLYVLFW